MQSIPNLFLMATLPLISTSASAVCARNEFGIFEDKTCAIDALELENRNLKTIHDGLTEKLDPKARKLLVRSQRAWLAYVDAEIELNYAIEGDGADSRIEAIQIRESFTHERVDELSGWKL